MSNPTLLYQKLFWCRNSLVFLTITILSSLRHSYVTASIVTSSNYSSNDELRLLHDVIDSFDPRIRPVRNHSQPIQVFVDYNLINLVKIDAVNQEIALNLWVNFTWEDQIRTWDPEDYGGVKVIHPKPGDIWLPKTILTNGVGVSDVYKDYDCPLSIHSNGKTNWYPNGVHEFACGMDLTYFPFDVQNCGAILMTTNDGTEIDFNLTHSEISRRIYLANGEWVLKSSSVRTGKLPISDVESLSVVVINVSYQRRPIFYVINVMLPITGLSFLTMFSFIVPKDSGERASFAMTVLLSLSFYMVSVSGLFPANSDTFPLVTIYVFGLLCLNMAAVIIVVCQLRMRAKQQQGQGPADAQETDQGNTTCFRTHPGIGNFQNKNNWTTKTRQTHDTQKHDDMFSNRLVAWGPNQVYPQNGPSINVTECGHEMTTQHRRYNGLVEDDDEICVHKDNAGLGRECHAGGEVESNRRRWWKKLLQEKDDCILFTIFTIVLLVFSLTFVIMISIQVYRIENEE